MAKKLSAEQTDSIAGAGGGIVSSIMGLIGAGKDPATQGATTGSSIGGAIGSAAYAIPGVGPIVGPIAQQLGSAIGGAIGGVSDAKYADNLRKQEAKRIYGGLNMVGAPSTGDLYGSFMRNGGLTREAQDVLFMLLGGSTGPGDDQPKKVDKAPDWKGAKIWKEGNRTYYERTIPGTTTAVPGSGAGGTMGVSKKPSGVVKKKTSTASTAMVRRPLVNNTPPIMERVYMEEQEIAPNPLQGFRGTLALHNLPNGSNAPAGLYQYRTRDSQNGAEGGATNTAEEYANFVYSNPDGTPNLNKGLYKIPGAEFRAAMGGSSGMFQQPINDSTFSKYKVPYFEDGGAIQGGQTMQPEMMQQQQMAPQEQGGAPQADPQQVIAAVAQQMGMSEEEVIQKVQEIAQQQQVSPEEVIQMMAQQLQQGAQQQQPGQEVENPQEQEGGQEEPQTVVVNIEKGELLVNPETTEIVRKFDNPNRYASHNSNKYKEPHGNFVDVPEGLVVVPKKLAGRFERGNKLTKRSIILEVMKNQAQNPEQSDPDTGRADLKAKDGVYAIPGPINDLKKNTTTIIPNFDPRNKRVPIATIGAGKPTPGPISSLNKMTTTLPAVKPVEPSEPEGPNGLGFAARNAIANAPLLAQILGSFSGAGSASHVFNPNTAAAFEQLNSIKTEVPTAHAEYAAARGFDTLKRSQFNYSGNRGADIAGMLGKLLDNSSGVHMAAATQQNQADSQKKQALSQFLFGSGANNQQEQVRVQSENNAGLATRQNIRNAAFSNMSSNVQQADNDMKMMNLLSGMSDFSKIKNMRIEDKDKILEAILGKIGQNIPASSTKTAPTK